MVQYLLFLGVTAILFTSCEKKSENLKSGSLFELYLTNAPVNFRGIWIDIQSVRLYMTGKDSVRENGWIEVPLFHPGLFNLKDLRKDTLLASKDIPAGKISQIRLLLGDDNYVILENGSKKRLTWSSPQQSDLKVNVQAKIQPGIPFAMVLDFDAGRSIIKKDHGDEFLFKPVVRTFPKSQGGIIEDVVLPLEAPTRIFALQNKDTIWSTSPDSSGGFKFRGLQTGAYRLLFDPDSSFFQKDSISPIQVRSNEVTRIDTVLLKTNGIHHIPFPSQIP